MKKPNRPITADSSLPGLASCLKLAGWVLLLILTLPACKKDFDTSMIKKLTWNPDLAVPLVNDSITLKRILTQGGNKNLVIDENGNISILYYFNNDAFRIRPNDLIKIVPASFSFLHAVTPAEQAILAVSDLALPTVTFNIDLSEGNPGARVDKLSVKRGNIRVSTFHTFDNDGTIMVRFLNATKNGIPFSFTLYPFISGPLQTVIDISGVAFDLTASPNIITAEVEGVLKKSGSPVSGDEIRANFQVYIDTIGTFEGFLGKQTLNQLDDTVKVNVFNNAYVLGELYFIDPQATISVVNSIGVPVDMTVEKLVAINDASGYAMNIADRLGAGAFIQIPSPSYPLVSPATTSVGYTNDNTGNAMVDFFNVKPDNVAFQVKTVVNPAGTPLNFFSDTSSLYADLRVKLPMWGHFDHLTYQDTFDLFIEKPEELEHLQFNTYIVNGMPMSAEMQVYFTDENYVKLDSLSGSDKILIREAPVDPATYLPYPGMYGIKDTTYILGMERMQNFENVRKMIFRAVLFSADNGQVDVKLLASQAIQIKFSAMLKLRTTIQPGK